MKEAATRAHLTGLPAGGVNWLTPALDAEWHWDASGEAIAWEDGTTVLMAEELALICERYGETSPPHLTAIISALAMLKGCHGASIPTHLETIRAQLAAWPRDLTKTPASKHALVEMLFVRRPSVIGAAGEEIATVIRTGWRPGLDDRLDRDKDRSVSRSSLLAAFNRITPDQLRLRLETGLEAVVQPTEALPDLKASSPGTLVEQLERDPETAGIVRLTRDIMAALTLPQAMPLKEERATGGVSDLSNRGPFHRLLLSELAHDDDMLAARLALNEALYLQPEPPAHRPPGSQILVMDCGLRLWGAARIFALSAALALRLKARPGTPSSAWRARGRAWEETDLDSLDGIKDHLTVLEASYDFTQAIASLPDKMAPLPDSRDVVLFVHEATLRDAAFRREIADHLENLCPLHIVAVTAEGRLTLHQYSRQGFKQLHEARLHLNKLLQTEPGSGTRRVSLPPVRPWPGIFNLPRLPFLIAPLSRVVSAITVTAHGDVPQTLFALTQNRDIWYISGARQGSRPVPMAPLRGKVLEFRGRDEPEPGVMACSWDQERHSIEVAVVTAPGRDESPGLKLWVMEGLDAHPKAWWVDGDHLLLLGARTIRALRLSDGVELTPYQVPDQLRHLGERHFTWFNESRYVVHHCLVEAGNIICSAFGHTEHTDPLVAFHRKGQLGVWQVGANGVILSPLGSHHMDGLAFPNRLTMAKVNPEGSRVWMKTQQGRCFIRDLGTGQLTTGALDQSPWPFYVEKTGFVHFSMRTRFEAVGLTPAGEIALRTHKGRIVVIMLENTWFRLQHRSDATTQDWRNFSEPVDTGHFCQVRIAEWPCGNRAFLDERGILHLQPADPQVPEVSLGLPSEMMLPAWSSDGLLVGPAAALDSGRPVTTDGAAIEDHIKRFVLGMLS